MYVCAWDFILTNSDFAAHTNKSEYNTPDHRILGGLSVAVKDERQSVASISTVLTSSIHRNTAHHNRVSETSVTVLQELYN